MNGVKFPDILKHENENMAIVDTNDIRGLHIADSDFSAFDKSTIAQDKRRKNFLLSCANSVYQYVSSDLSDTEWVKAINWRSVQTSIEGDFIKVFVTAEEISSKCGSEDIFVACKNTGILYKFVEDATYYREIGEGQVIDTKEGSPTGFVDFSLLTGSDVFLSKANNLSDVEDRQTALNNIAISEEAEAGQVLYYDGENVSYKTLPDPMHIKGRVDTVEDLPTTGVEKGDVYLVGLAGSENFEEYVCIDNTTTPITWECLGSKKSILWVVDTNSDFSTSVKLKYHGYVNDSDTVSVLGEKSLSYSSQNITISPLCTNATTASSTNIFISNNTAYTSNNVFIAASNRCSIAATENVFVGATEGDIIPYISPRFNSSTPYAENGAIKNTTILSNTIGENGILYLRSENGFIAANIIASGKSANFSRTENCSKPKMNIVIGNSFNATTIVSAEKSVFISNKITNNGFYFYETEESDSCVFIANEFTEFGLGKNNKLVAIGSTQTSVSQSGGTGIIGNNCVNNSLYNSYFGVCRIEGSNLSLRNSNVERFSLFGSFNVIDNCYGLGFNINGTHNSVDSCYIGGGVFNNSTSGSIDSEYNKFFATKFDGGNIRVNYSTIQASHITSGTNFSTYSKYISVLATDFSNGGTWNEFNNTSNECVLIAATEATGYTIGYNNRVFKYSSILNSYISGCSFGGNYNTILGLNSSGTSLCGDNNTMIGISNSSGTTVTGNGNTVIASYAGYTISGNNNISLINVGSGCGITGDNNISAISNGCPITGNKSISLLTNGGKITGTEDNVLIATASCSIGAGSYNSIGFSSGSIIVAGNHNLIGFSTSGTIESGTYNMILGTTYTGNYISGGTSNSIISSYQSQVLGANVNTVIASYSGVIGQNVVGSAIIAGSNITATENHTLYTDNVRSNKVYVRVNNEYVELTPGASGSMVFKGEVQTYEDLPTDAEIGWVYSIQEEVEVYNGNTPDLPIGFYPPSTNFVRINNGWESLGGYIITVSDDEIDEICVL